MLGWKEPNIMTSPYGAVGERPETPLSSNDQIYQNMSVHGRQAEVVINSSAPYPGFMNKYVHSPGPPANKNSRMQEREEPNIPTPSDARDPAVGRTSSSNDQDHQNINNSTKEVQGSDAVINPSTLENAAVVSEEHNMPTPFDARDPSVGRTSSSNDQVHQNMYDRMKEVQDSDAWINPSTLENAAVVLEEPKIPTPFDARDPAVGRKSSSNDQVHQNKKNNMKEVQDSDAVINPSTLEKAAVVFDWLNDFPPLTVGGKLVKSAMRK